MAVASEAEGWPEAQRRIAACREMRSESLDLSELGLTRVPEELMEFDWLRELDLKDNQIGAEGARALSSANSRVSNVDEFLNWLTITAQMLKGTS